MRYAAILCIMIYKRDQAVALHTFEMCAMVGGSRYIIASAEDPGDAVAVAAAALICPARQTRYPMEIFSKYMARPIMQLAAMSYYPTNKPFVRQKTIYSAQCRSQTDDVKRCGGK